MSHGDDISFQKASLHECQPSDSSGNMDVALHHKKGLVDNRLSTSVD